MEVSYYPGCSLHGMAAEYDESIRAVCDVLDVELVELADWNCCGASSAHFLDDELAVQLPARNMLIAERAGRDVLVPCAACFHRMKCADKALRENGAKWSDEPYEGRSTVFHVNDFFADPEWMGNSPNWQQGFTIVHFYNDKILPEFVHIVFGSAIHRGKLYQG